MKLPILASAIVILFLTGLGAQSLPDLKPPATPDPEADPEAVAEAIRKFNESSGRPGSPKEIVVDLTTIPPPPAKQAVAAPPAVPANKSASPAPDPDAVPDPPPNPAPPATDDHEPAATKPAASLTVKVEQLESANGPIDPATVKLLAPFPAKPLGTIPPGWKLDESGAAPAFTRSVEIAANTSITLNIKPHVLVPVADGATTFSVNEPGFDPACGYQQVQTVGAVLTRTIVQLDEDAKQLGNAIDHLQQLVSSLPKPAAKPESKPPSTQSKPSNKR